ncbi:MAG: deoxyribodipyrimidine photo-lyase [Bacteroidales bacterium]|nr:deoxyribodipyrimidine photo-lyase [Bacteroidales bacterium]
MKVNIFWFRRDLRLEDNTALEEALGSGLPVLPVFIFDTNITEELASDDARISFIYDTLASINHGLKKWGSSLKVIKGDPHTVWQELISSYDINSVLINKDYEPYALQRDIAIEVLLRKHNIALKRYKDQVIFGERDILKADNTPYTIFTPYKARWLQKFNEILPFKNSIGSDFFKNFHKCNFEFPAIEKIGFYHSSLKVRPYDLTALNEYEKYRDLPFADRTSYLSPHLRFGTVSIRNLVTLALKSNQTFLNELIWREFFMQILFNFPKVVTENFRSKYDGINWINREDEFEKWCNGETGYPLVDAGMRQLNTTGYMHNRVRMVTAGFLCKHLLIDWRWGEAYFAGKLLDYELSSNNGNWQWAAGTGCDAAPYFRIFSPDSQQKRFDPKMEYIRKWVPDFEKSSYPKPMIEHDFARKRAIETYKSGIK